MKLGIAEPPGESPPAFHRYQAYGLCLRSQWALPCPEVARSDLPEVELVDGPSSLLSGSSQEAMRGSEGRKWFHYARLSDGSDYLYWAGLFEFLVSVDGRRITCHPLNGSSREAFETYLLGHVLSFALLRQAIEPLHATVVVVDGGAVAFMGDCGYGKSTLAAAFLQAGHRLLTDDLLVVKEEAAGFFGYPGLPRIKLFPDIAKSLLGQRISGTPMHPLTPKLVIPLGREERMLCQGVHRLKAIYALAPHVENSRSDRITIRPFSARRAVLELLKNTFNAVVMEPARLKCQFDLAARLASKVPIRSLSFPRTLARLPAVREAIQSDLLA